MVFQKLAKQYSQAKPLQYHTSYVLYKDFDSKKVAESYQGVFYKNSQNEIYMKIGDTEILNTKAINLKISHPEKAVEISNAVANYFGDFEMKPLLELCKVAQFTDHKAYWEITLVSKPYSSLPYSKIIVQVSKNYFLKKQVFYYNTATNFSQDYRKPDAHYPRLEILYTNYKRTPIKASIFSSDRYLTVTKQKGIVMSQQYKQYEIIDQRNNSNN